MSSDQKLTDALQNMTGEMPKPRESLSEPEKDDLIQMIGPRTAKNILSMRGKTSVSRIPFLFSSIDTQAIVDLLANDCTAAIERAVAKKSKGKSGLKG